MRKQIFVFAFVFAGLAQVGCASTSQLEKLRWIAGHWVMAPGADQVNEELWLEPRGGMMIGVHRDVQNGKVTGFEFLRIIETADGVAYLASPGGRSATTFPLKQLSANRVVFENPKHDFPQRIIYFKKDASLCARVEGLMDGHEAGEEWCWTAAQRP